MRLVWPVTGELVTTCNMNRCADTVCGVGSRMDEVLDPDSCRLILLILISSYTCLTWLEQHFFNRLLK